MTIATWIFSETTPAAAGSAASANVVTGGSGTQGAAGILSNNLLERGAMIGIRAQLVGATGGTLDVYVQTSLDEGGTWQDCVHFAQLASGGAAVQSFVSLSRTALAPTVIGINSSPALAAGSAVQGVWGQMFRLWMVAGSGTSVGAAIKVYVTCCITDNGK